MTNQVRLCVPVVDEHERVAGDAGDAVHLLGGERRQDEDPSLVVTDAALVLHLKKKRQQRIFISAMPSNKAQLPRHLCL